MTLLTKEAPATEAIIPAKSASPESMVDRINGLYRLVNQHVRTSVETGLELGRTLCECRQSIGHGDWQTWIATHLTFSYRTARRYEQLWSRRDDVAKFIENGHVSLLDSTSLTAVYRHLEIIISQEENEDRKRKEEEAISPASETFGEEGNKPAPIAQDGAEAPDPPVLEAHEVTREVPSWESSGVAQKELVIEDDQEVPTITRQEEASKEITRLCRRGPWKREKLLLLRCSNPKDVKMADIVAKRLLFMLGCDQETLGMLLERIENYVENHGHVRPPLSTLTTEWIEAMRRKREWGEHFDVI